MSNFRSVPVYTLAKKIPPPSDKTNIPGPGAYNVVINPSSLQHCFGTEDRTDHSLRKAKDNIVGPGQYELNVTTLQTVGGVSGKEQRSSITRKTCDPGPARYNPITRTWNQPSYSIGKEKRKGLEALNKNPGPPKYHLDWTPVEDSVKTHLFGKEQRSNTVEKKENHLGPGQYNWDKHKPGGDIALSRNERKSLRIENSSADLGPGQYEVDHCDIKTGQIKNKGWSMPKRNNSVDHNEYKPGPCTYNPETSKYKPKAPTTIFGSERRKSMSNRSAIPGPGNYPMQFNRDHIMGKFGTSERNYKDSINKGSGISPSKYDVVGNYKITRDSAPNYSIGTSKRINMGSMEHVPAPGTYESSKDLGNLPKYSFGKQDRSRDESAGVNLPGPDRYDVMLKIGNGGNTFSKQARQAEKVDQTPGYYNLPSSVPDVPKYLLEYKDV